MGGGVATRTLLAVGAGVCALLVLLLIAAISRWQQPSRGSYTRAGKEDELEHEQQTLDMPISGAVFLVDDVEEEGGSGGAGRAGDAYLMCCGCFGPSSADRL